MMTRRFMSALEPMFVSGLVVALALVGLPSLSSVISLKVQPLAAVSLDSEESTPVALANDKSQPTTNR